MASIQRVTMRRVETIVAFVAHIAPRAAAGPARTAFVPARTLGAAFLIGNQSERSATVHALRIVGADTETGSRVAAPTAQVGRHARSAPRVDTAPPVARFIRIGNAARPRSAHCG